MRYLPAAGIATCRCRQVKRPRTSGPGSQRRSDLRDSEDGTPDDDDDDDDDVDDDLSQSDSSGSSDDEPPRDGVVHGTRIPNDKTAVTGRPLAAFLEHEVRT